MNRLSRTSRTVRRFISHAAVVFVKRVCAAEPIRWRAICLRYFNPAGAHPSGLIGEDPRGRPGNLLPLLAHMAVGRVNESTLQVFGDDYPTPCVFFYVLFPLFSPFSSLECKMTDFFFSRRDGTCVRDYLHVLDLASGHLLALDALAPGSTVFDNCPTPARYKAYNLGRGQGFSVLQILEAMRAATGFDYTYNIIGRRCVSSYPRVAHSVDGWGLIYLQARRRPRSHGGPLARREGARLPCKTGPEDYVP